MSQKSGGFIGEGGGGCITKIDFQTGDLLERGGGGLIESGAQ